MALSQERIEEIRRQLKILEPKAALAVDAVVKGALEARIADLRKELGEVVEPAPLAQAEPAATTGQAELDFSEPEPQPAPTSPAKVYHVLVHGQAQGPMDAVAVLALLAAGTITQETRLWSPGDSQWESFTQFPDLMEAASASASAAPGGTPAGELKPEAGQLRSKKHRPEDDIVIPAPATAQQAHQAEEILRGLRTAKIRKQNDEAARLLGRALQLAPGSADVQEAVGDDYMEKGKLGEASLAYFIATKLAPRNANIERKYATTVLRREGGGMTWESAILTEAADTEEAKKAMFLSVVIPGAGQCALEDYVKGGVMLAVHIISFAATFLIFRHDYYEKLPFSKWMLLPFGILIVNWIVSISDLAQRAKGTGLPSGLGAAGSLPTAKGEKPQRPQPPVNLPFE